MQFTPEVAGVTFSDSDSTPVPKILRLGLEIFQLENPTLVQTSATIDPNQIYLCFNLEMTTQTSATAKIEKWLRIQVWFFTNLTPDLGLKEKRRILSESAPALPIHGHLWFTPIFKLCKSLRCFSQFYL